MVPIMLLYRIAMFLLLIIFFLTGFLHCLRLNTVSFLSLINHILSDSDNFNNNNSDSGNSNNNNSGSSGNTFTPAIGVLDTSFNSPNGFIIQPIGSGNDDGRSLAIQPDGKILLGGTCSRDFCIARFDSNGTLDTSFGTGGKVIQFIGPDSDIGNSLAIQPDGKILLGGYCFRNVSSYDFCIARFNSNGTLNTSFGDSGIIIQPIGSGWDLGFSLGIQPDGKILLGGHVDRGISWDFSIARFNSDGTLDTSFGDSGKVIRRIGSSLGYVHSLAIQPDRKILLGGYCRISGNSDFCIARFNSDGTLDNSFGSPNGYIIQPIGSSDDYGQSLAIQPNGKILLGGRCSNGSNFDFCIARFNPNGTLDTTFGTGGKVIQDIGSSDDNGQSLAIQPDGKILLGGICSNGSNDDFCIARFNSDGSLDTTFGNGGKVIQYIGAGFSLAIQPDGKILLGGYCRGVSNFDFCIARFNSNGTLDNSFGTGGKVIQPIGSFGDEGYSLAIQPDGKILLGGSCGSGSSIDFCIARFK